jgi:hypothetical protein
MSVFLSFSHARRCLPRLADAPTDFVIDDQNAIARICKGSMDALRKAWKSVYLAEQKERGKGRDDRSTPLLDYRKRLEASITDLAKETIEMVHKKLIVRAKDASIRGLLFKMAGDFWRYLAEIQRGYDRRESANKALAAYQEAEDLIVASTGPAAAVRLALLLNMAIFRFEILSEPDEALELARKAYDEGIAAIDSLREEAYADSILLLQMIHRTMAAWSRNK